MKRIPLTQGKFALVDDEDFERVNARKWYAIRQPKRHHEIWYAVRHDTKHSPLIYLHRFILGAPKGVQIDHEDGDGLNCRRKNMREATHGENIVNRERYRGRVFTSKYRGVHKAGSGPHPWRAAIREGGKQIYLGSFATEEEAARVRDSEARRVYGRFARLNFPEVA